MTMCLCQIPRKFNTIFTQILALGYYYFLPNNKDKNLQIVPHCNIIQGYITIKFYTHLLIYYYVYVLNITFIDDKWQQL